MMAAGAAVPLWAVLAGTAVATAGTAAIAMSNKPKIPAAVSPVDQSAAAQAAAMSNADDLRRRRGAGANALTGSSGAEASTPGAKVLLGQ